TFSVLPEPPQGLKQVDSGETPEHRCRREQHEALLRSHCSSRSSSEFRGDAISTSLGRLNPATSFFGSSRRQKQNKSVRNHVRYRIAVVSKFHSKFRRRTSKPSVIGEKEKESSSSSSSSVLRVRAVREGEMSSMYSYARALFVASRRGYTKGVDGGLSAEESDRFRSPSLVLKARDGTCR
ncbi:unnamed protein product, partial [Ixodes pacificus]